MIEIGIRILSRRGKKNKMIETDRYVKAWDNTSEQGLSRYLETECPNRGFIDFCVSKVWYKVYTTNKINPIHIHILLF